MSVAGSRSPSPCEHQHSSVRALRPLPKRARLDRTSSLSSSGTTASSSSSEDEHGHEVGQQQQQRTKTRRSSSRRQEKSVKGQERRKSEGEGRGQGGGGTEGDIELRLNRLRLGATPSSSEPPPHPGEEHQGAQERAREEAMTHRAQPGARGSEEGEVELGSSSGRTRTTEQDARTPDSAAAMSVATTSNPRSATGLTPDDVRPSDRGREPTTKAEPPWRAMAISSSSALGLSTGPAGLEPEPESARADRGLGHDSSIEWSFFGAAGQRFLGLSRAATEGSTTAATTTTLEQLERLVVGLVIDGKRVLESPAAMLARSGVGNFGAIASGATQSANSGIAAPRYDEHARRAEDSHGDHRGEEAFLDDDEDEDEDEDDGDDYGHTCCHHHHHHNHHRHHAPQQASSAQAPTSTAYPSSVSDGAVALAKNRKKRKVPGASSSSSHWQSADAADAGESSSAAGRRGSNDGPAAAASVAHAPCSPASEFDTLDLESGHDGCAECAEAHERHRDSAHRPLRASVISQAIANPPKTAAEALAKLLPRPPHVSRSAMTSSARTDAHQHVRQREPFRSGVKQGGFVLSPLPRFVPPAEPQRDGPRPLPPGSGLKGSRALKAAKKAERERAKEQERIEQALGGPKQTFDFYRDIEYLVRRHRWSALSHSTPTTMATKPKKESAKIAPGGLPTPPSSDDGNSVVPATSSMPMLDTFTFECTPPASLLVRWKTLCTQVRAVRLAREKDRIEREQELLLEQKRKIEAEQQQRKEQDQAAKQPPPPPSAARPTKTPASPQKGAKAPPTPSATPVRPKTVAPKPVVSPAPVSKSADPVAKPATVPAPAPPSSAPPVAAKPATAKTTSSPEPPATPVAPAVKDAKKGKKKKRSALANANNVHHRDNYIPSRLPSQDSAPADEASGSSAPHVHPHAPHPNGSSFFAGTDEWLCAFCEYEIFYGEPSLLALATRRRKKVLRIRRKAQARARKATAEKKAADDAAATTAAAPPPPTTTATMA